MTWHSRKVGTPGKGPRACTKCGNRAPCKDSEDYEQHVWRRYKCPCGNKWTTYEVILDESDLEA